MDPSHSAHQFLDPAAFVDEFADRIYHVHVKDSRRSLDGRRSILGSHLDFGAPERGWEFVSPGRGDVDFEAFVRALNRADERPLTLWRSPQCDVVVRHDTVSRRHAEIRREASGWYVTDLGSSNGTWIDGRRVEREARVRAGDQILLGGCLVVAM